MRMVWFFLLLFFQVWVFKTGEGKGPYRPTVVNIGAILTFDSTIGKVAKIAIEEAVNDVNSNSSILANTQLVLIVQNTNCTGFPAIIEVLQFLEADVAAIIGPQSSILASIASNAANNLQVPLLSFGATDPTLSALQFPFFVRMTQSDLYQMDTVAEIVTYFGWKEVIALYINDVYGRNGVVTLSEKLAKRRCRISHKFGLRPTATQKEIIHILKKISQLESQILVLHVNPGLGFQVFSEAKDFGMMGNGYAWIATDWLTSVLDSAPSPYEKIDNMQGVLALRQHTPVSNKKTKFFSQWNNVTRGSLGVNTYGLYAYDSVWTVAYALEAMFNQNIFDDQMLLLKNIQESNFEGLTGLIKFSSDGSLVFPTYDVLNVIGSGLRRVGYWSSYSGLSSIPPEALSFNPPNGSSSSQQLRTIIWPGETSSVPHGWVFINNDENQLRIGVPNRVSYREFVSLDNKTGTVQGFCVEVFTSAINLLPYPVRYKFIPFGDGHQNPSYTKLVNMITMGDFDAAIGDISIIINRTKIVEFTLPYASTGLVVVAPFNTMSLDLWAFLHPFTLDLWIVTVCFFIIVGIIVWMMEHRVNNEFRGPPRQQAITALWFSLSTMFFAQRENTQSTLGRLVVIVWLFVVFIITSNYTASLTTFLTVHPLSSPIEGIDNLLESNDPIGYQFGSFAEIYLIETLNISQSRLVPLRSPEEYATALRLGPKRGGVAAIVDERPYADIFIKDEHETFGIVGQEFTKSGWGFAFPKDSLLVEDVSIAILTLVEDGEMQRIYDKWLKKTGYSLENTEVVADQMGLKSFMGLYLICGCVLLFAVLVHLVTTCQRVTESGERIKKVRRFVRQFGKKGKRMRVERSETNTEMESISQLSTSTKSSSHSLLWT